jgi:hypothetical protein
VVGYGEANAWPRGTPLGPHPELVHWAAERIATGERFEALIAPQHPLAPSFTRHTGLAAERFTGAQTFAAFSERWRTFVRENDVLCGWGYFSSELLRTQGAAVPRRFDVRQGVRQFLRMKPGDIAQVAARLSADLPAPWVMGRTGLRVAALAAIVRNLVARASG